MGLMSAYMLNRAGHTVSLFDPSLNAPEPVNASARAGGMLAPYSEIEHMSEEWVAAGLHGIKMWRGIDLPTEFEQKGSILIAHPDDRYMLERFKTHLPHAISQNVTIAEHEPEIATKFTTGLFLKDEAHLNPLATMQALITHLKDQKVSLLNKSADIPDVKDNFDTVIDCRGMGAKLPDIRGVKGESLIVRNNDFKLTRPVRLMHPRYPLYIIPREDNIFMIGATNIESTENEHVSLRSSMELMSALYALSPSFADAHIIEMSAGIRPAYTDNLPRITINGNVISCNGLFRHGYLLSPVMAQCVASYLAGEENQYMSLFRGKSDENHDQRAA